MFKNHLFRSIVIAAILIAATTITATASWTDYFNPISYFTTAESAPLAVAGAPAMVIGTCDTAGPIEVEATAGTPGPTLYASLNAAFTAINAGTHQGDINVEVCGNTSESASAILNSGAVAPASYSSVIVRPVGGARIIEGTITGAIIKLNGADNVTIDGRQGGVGTARDLTVRNNSTSAATAAVWLASVAAGNGASNNIVRNLELAGGTDTSASANSTFGIIMNGTTISTTANGVDNDNNSFTFNRIIKVRYGIVTRGTTTDLNINPVVTDNIIGPSAFGTDQINKTGIFMQADTGALVSRNTVQFVGCLDPQACSGADRMGIAIGDESWSMAPSTLTSNNYTVTRNVIHDVIEENTFSAVGLRLGTTGGGVATNNLVANNFIYNVRANGTSGDNAAGIGISGGHTDSVVNNSVSMTGDVDPGVATATTNFGSGIRIANASSASHANMTVSNNSVYMDLSSSSTATVRYYAISGPSNAYSFGTGGENFNNLYINPANTQLQTGGLGTTSGLTLTTQFATLALWQAAYTAPQDANSIQQNPNYASPTADLHIVGGSPNVDVGTTIAAVTVDIDNQARPNGAAYDIGADEFYATPGTVQFSGSTFNDTEGNSATITVTRAGGSSGAISVQYTTGVGTANNGTCGNAGVDYQDTSGTLNWADGDATAKTFTVLTCNDALAESTETVNLLLFTPVGTTIGTPGTAILNIIDNPPGTVQFSSVTYSGNEGTSATVTATRTGGTSGAVTVDYATSPGTATAGGSCAGAVDYVTASGMLSWANGDGASKTFTVQLCNDNSEDIAETVTLTLSNATGGVTIGANNPATLTINDVVSQFCNADGTITIPPTSATPPFPSTPYPSVINVSGLVGTTNTVRVSLSNVSHTFPDDIDILLVSPTGQKFILMSDAGGSSAVTNRTLTFSDAAATQVPDASLASGTYRPANYETANDVFATGAPAGPYGDPGPGGTPAGTGTLNGTFSGASPNGTWQLFVSDDANGDGGTITGWCLEITTIAANPGAVQFSSTTYAGNEGTSATITATRTGGSSGAISADYTTTPGTASEGTCGTDDYVDSTGTLNWADGDSASKTFTVQLCTDAIADPTETVNLTLSNPTGGATIGANNPAVLTIGDVPPPFNGTYTVGTGGDYPSLTNTGGIFEAINLSGATDNIQIEITTDLTGETGTHALNEIAGGHTTTIYPCSNPISITGSNAGALIRLNGADNVKINGDSNACSPPAAVGGTPASRHLTIQNTNTGTSATVISIGSNGTNGAQNNTIQNVNILGQDPTTTLLGISLGGATTGTIATGPNNGNKILNNSIKRAIFGVYSAGQTATPNTGTEIRENETSAVTGDRIRRIGIVVINDDGAQITENSLNGISTNESADAIGISIGTLGVDSTTTTSGGVSNALVDRNKINGVASLSTTGFSAAGIAVAGGSLGANTIRNNMITGVTAPSTSPDFPAGVYVIGAIGSITRLHHNSISMTGDRGAVSGQMPSYGVAITGTNPLVEMKNNIFYTSQTASGGGANAFSYAVGMVSTTFTNLDSNYNNFFSTGANDGGFRTGSLEAAAGLSHADLTAWQTAITDDANSLEFDPTFINPVSDLHLNADLSIVIGQGITGFATVDYDNDPRPATNPEMGADEVVQSSGGVIPAGTFYNALAAPNDQLGGSVTITNSITLNGILNTGNFNSLTLDCTASFINANSQNYVFGTVNRQYCGTGTFVYPVGTPQDGNRSGSKDAGNLGNVSEYTPVTANVTGGTFPSYLSARAFDAFLPGLDPTSAISRYWAVEELGDLTADLTFQYLDMDVNGNEALYRVFRAAPGLIPLMYNPHTIDNALNTGTATGVQNFSHWSLGAFAPSASGVNVSGRLLTPNGGGLKNARVMLTDSRGNVRTVLSSSFGYYGFDNVLVGETYVITVGSKRFTFTPRTVQVLDEVTDLDLIAEGEQ